MPKLKLILCLSLSTGLLACASGPRLSPAGEATRAAGRLQLHSLDAAALIGASGLAAGEGGRYYAVTERGGRLVELQLGAPEQPPQLGPVRTIQGARAGLDLEAVAGLNPGELAFGTEADEARQQDAVLVAKLTPTEAQVVGERPLPYAPWGLEPARNQGLEALCSTERFLIAGTEAAHAEPAGRRAGLAVAPRAGGAWTYHSYYLSSEHGKLSALSCRDQADGRVELLGIERHFERLRIIRLHIDPTHPSEPPQTAEIYVELGGLFQGMPPNFEGLARRGDWLVLLSDNQYKGVQGPTVLLWVKAP